MVFLYIFINLTNNYFMYLVTMSTDIMSIVVDQSISGNLVCHSLSTFNTQWWNYFTKIMERLDSRENNILVNILCF